MPTQIRNKTALVAGRSKTIPQLVGSPLVMRVLATGLCVLVLGYILLPVYWMIIAAMKTNGGVVGSVGLVPPANPRLFTNLSHLFSFEDHAFIKWSVNSLLYTGVGGFAATAFSVAAGYALAAYRFAARIPVILSIIIASAVPQATLALPLYLLVTDLGLANTRLGVLLALSVSPFGVFLMWLYFHNQNLTPLIEAGRLDGASEFRIFWRIAIPVSSPAIVTTFLLIIVTIFNNYLLPLLLLTSADVQPLTVGLARWAANGQVGVGAGTQLLYTLVVTGTLVTIIPILALFLFLQRYWKNGLATGSVTG